MEKWQIEHLAAKCRLTLEARGFEVCLVHDFGLAQSLMEAMGKVPSAILDPARNLFTQRNSLWMFVMRDAKPVIGGGVRVEDIGAESFDAFLERSLLHTFGVKPIKSNLDVFGGRLSGRVAYFGDLVAETAVGMTPAGKEAIRLFTAYGHHRVFADLDADCTYCFLRGRDWRRASSYGFLDTDPFHWQTDKMMYPDGNPEWIAHLHRSRLPALLAAVSGLVINPLAKDQELFIPTEGTNAACYPDKGKAHVQRA